MKRLREIHDQIASLPNLRLAWLAFRRGKRSRARVAAFELDADRHLCQLHRALVAGSWRPSGYRTHIIHKPKPRLIAAAPARDRVVHHAIHRVLAPRLDRGLIDQTYACLPGRGTHRAAIAFLGALRRHRWLLMLDIRHYFLSIDHAVLMQLMARKIKDRRALALLERIVRGGDGLYRHPDVARALGLRAGFPPAGCGLPIGNLTSQWWGNHYLSGLDHFIKRDVGVPYVQRYMDDSVLMSDDRGQLATARERIADWLARERKLSLKHRDAEPRRTSERFGYLGFAISRRAGIEPSPGVWRRVRRRMHDLDDRGDTEPLERAVASYAGILR